MFRSCDIVNLSLRKMKVLWFTNTPSCYMSKGDYNGGGWISSLENIISKSHPEIKLGIAFYDNLMHDGWNKVKDSAVTYYPMSRLRNSFSANARQVLLGRASASVEHETHAIPQLMEIVKDFNPDIIHVFGSENIYGLLSKYTNIPLVLHIQGILSSITNAFLPPSISWNDYIFSSFSLKSVIWHLRERFSFERNTCTELRMFRNIKYFMGRTEWDKAIIRLINPSARYFNCGEILRDVFYECPTSRHESVKPIFVSVISWQVYKGYDLILKTANLLNELDETDFEWHIYGNVNPKLIEKRLHLSSKNTVIKFKGVVTAAELREAFRSAVALIHPSYVENSSNVICEAQMSGCPCIATNVGGTPSIVEHGKTGILVPSNDPFLLAENMKHIMSNSALRLRLSENAYRVASKRHDRKNIVERVVEIYRIIKNQSQGNTIDCECNC